MVELGSPPRDAVSVKTTHHEGFPAKVVCWTRDAEHIGEEIVCKIEQAEDTVAKLRTDGTYTEIEPTKWSRFRGAASHEQEVQIKRT